MHVRSAHMQHYEMQYLAMSSELYSVATRRVGLRGLCRCLQTVPRSRNGPWIPSTNNNDQKERLTHYLYSVW